MLYLVALHVKIFIFSFPFIISHPPFSFPSPILIPHSHSPFPFLISIPHSSFPFQLAYQLHLNKQPKDSLVHYKKAMNVDETSVPALAGIIFCQIMEGQTSEAEQQLEFLAEVMS